MCISQTPYSNRNPAASPAGGKESMGTFNQNTGRMTVGEALGIQKCNHEFIPVQRVVLGNKKVAFLRCVKCGKRRNEKKYAEG